MKLNRSTSDLKQQIFREITSGHVVANLLNAFFLVKLCLT